LARLLFVALVVGLVRTRLAKAELFSGRPGAPRRMANVQYLDVAFAYSIENLVRVANNKYHPHFRTVGSISTLRLTTDLRYCFAETRCNIPRSDRRALFLNIEEFVLDPKTPQG
jgi:hypothetical protein